MERYQIVQRVESGLELYVLEDHGTRTEVHVVPAIGHNALRFRQATDRAWLDILSAPQDAAALREQPMRFGNPVLAPYPNRVRAGQFTFRGQSYRLPVTMGGHAIHGLVFNKPWRVVDATADAASAAITARFESAAHPDVRAWWPFPFAVQLTYRLREGVLWQEAEIFNEGEREFPFGYGIHPWFNAALTGGDRKGARIQVPAHARWELDALIPTGRIVDVTDQYDLRQGRALGDAFYDDVFTRLDYERGWGVARLWDPAGAYCVEVGFDKAFREFVLYAPTDRPVVCFEPYTCTTDAFNLAARGVDSGMQVLAPGQSWRGMIYFALSRT